MDITRRPEEHHLVLGIEADEVVDAILTLLALVFAGLLVAEFALDLSSAQSRSLELAGLAIWFIFTVDFVVRLGLADSKWRYLRSNWLAAIAVALPAFRVARVFRAIRVLRLLRLGRVVTTTNRSVGAVRRLAPGGMTYVGLLGGLGILLGGAGMYTLEQGVDGSHVGSFGDALWWAAATLTTVGSGIDPVTLEGRILALLMMLFGLALSGFITATLAVILMGRRGGSWQEEDDVHASLAALREEIARLRESVERANQADR
ncbi:MAG TPA: potassium channel family protein [Tepidiformaceae bacterium]|nr:potassium channel family protein [Tepidiformaceae bacterium]